MTLPTSGAISTDAILAELQAANPSRALPLSLTDSDVLSLAGKSAGPLSIPGDLYGKSSYVPLSVVGHNDSGTDFTGSAAGTVSCAPSVTVSGGSGGTTYAWSFTSNPNNCTLSNATSATCTVSHAYAINSTGNASAVLQCVVSDNTSHSTTAGGISATLDWSP